MENKTWYAVQVGDGFEWDNGSHDLDKAKAMAAACCEDSGNDGNEVRIAVIDESGSEPMCVDEILIREGKRV